MINVVIGTDEEERDKNSTWVTRDAENLAPYRAMQDIQDEIRQEGKKYLRRRVGMEEKDDEDTDHDNQKDDNDLLDDSLSV